jgi:hypothetical protein
MGKRLKIAEVPRLCKGSFAQARGEKSVLQVAAQQDIKYGSHYGVVKDIV